MAVTQHHAYLAAEPAATAADSAVLSNAWLLEQVADQLQIVSDNESVDDE